MANKALKVVTINVKCFTLLLFYKTLAIIIPLNFISLPPP